jgi:acetoin utilization deacetylase AcuC-like enzyme
MKTGFVFDPIYLEHRLDGNHHPECPERLQAIIDAVDTSPLKRELILLKAFAAEERWIEAVHPGSHIKSIRKASERAPVFIDADTYVHRNSFEAARTACGGVMAGVDAAISGMCDNAFCAVRPPGHHAESHRAMGFCLFNNIAVGARYAQRKYGLQKIFIIDWDVHHGNGTQEIFLNDPSVFYFSIHQFPLYPGTGRHDEIGVGEGRGFTYNAPLSAGCGDPEYQKVFDNDLQTLVDQFKPELIMISAGFDAHAGDPLAGMNVTTGGFAELTRSVKRFAKSYCKNRIVSVLEGGYDLRALAESVFAHLQVLMHD